MRNRWEGRPWSWLRRPPGFDALPPLVDDPVAFAEAARRNPMLQYPLAVQRASLPPHVDAAVQRLVMLGANAPVFRVDRLIDARRHAEQLRSLSDEIEAAYSASLSVATRARNPALWCAMIDGLGLPCIDLPAKLFPLGASAVGVQPDTGLWALKSPQGLLGASRPTMVVAAFRNSAPEYVAELRGRLEANARAAKSAPESDAAAALRSAWESAAKEVDVKRSAVGPLSFRGPTKRFSVRGTHAMRPLLRFSR